MGAPFQVVAGGHADKFTFQLEGNETVYAVPYVGDMSTHDVYAMTSAAQEGEAAALKWAIEKFMEWVPQAVEQMTIEQFGYLIGAWRTAGKDAQGVDMGESEASPS